MSGVPAYTFRRFVDPVLVARISRIREETHCVRRRSGCTIRFPEEDAGSMRDLSRRPIGRSRVDRATFLVAGWGFDRGAAVSQHQTPRSGRELGRHHHRRRSLRHGHAAFEQPGQPDVRPGLEPRGLEESRPCLHGRRWHGCPRRRRAGQQDGLRPDPPQLHEGEGGHARPRRSSRRSRKSAP